MVGYIYDQKLRNKINKNDRQNYWDAYINEILGMLGVKGHRISLADLKNNKILKKMSVLIVGNVTGHYLSDSTVKYIDKWVSTGGILIGFGVQILDQVFGITIAETKKQKGSDDYLINGYLDFIPDELTFQLHPFHYQEQKLPIISEIKYIKNVKAKEIGRLFDIKKKPAGCPAITWNKYGKGFAGYFAFDVAKTIWLLHQGKPLAKEHFEHTSKLSVLENNSRMVPYGDELAFLIQNMISQKPFPFIYQIPPDNNAVPDALFYWSGDEYRGPTKISIEASDWMKKKNLPYHINIEADRHPMTQKEYQHIIDNGHEISLFFYMRPEDGEVKLTPEIIKNQVKIFKKRFGGTPGSNLFWHTNWQGWSEPARWMAEAGCTADNTFTGNYKDDKDDPYANGPRFNFGCGTGFPFYFYDDFSHENKQINLIEQPFAFYEMGHHGTMPLKNYSDHKTDVSDELHLPIQTAIKYHMVLNVFYHPLAIVENLRCRNAIKEILRYIKSMKLKVLHMGANQLADWWHDRKKSFIQKVTWKKNSLELKYKCVYKGGMIIKLAINEKKVMKIEGCSFNTIKKEFGNSWLFISVPYGTDKVIIDFDK